MVACQRRGAVLAIWAAQALLMALVLKLRISRAIDNSEAPPASGPYRVQPATLTISFGFHLHLIT